VVDPLPSVEFGQAPLDPGQEHQPRDGVLQRRIRWQLFDRFEDLLLRATPDASLMALRWERDYERGDH
jgi:hypothetical protein